MSHLPAAKLEEFRRELDRQLLKLERSMTVGDEALKTVDLDQGAVGRLSRIDSLQNQEIAKGLRERETVKLAMIQEALKRMENGEYGICTGCGSEIALGRLYVSPEAATCGACGY